MLAFQRSIAGNGFISEIVLLTPDVFSSIATPVAAIRSKAQHNLIHDRFGIPRLGSEVLDQIGMRDRIKQPCFGRLSKQTKVDALNFNRIVLPISLAKFINLGVNRTEHEMEIGRTELFLKIRFMALEVIGLHAQTDIDAAGPLDRASEQPNRRTGRTDPLASGREPKIRWASDCDRSRSAP